ncbi:hypothetical protein ACPV5I_07320 [Vibrio gigantis]|uniref:hypothetical protein n=1 Tax=Vibrio crassostreae TaxID=246167 RepID=UPI002E187F79|nr:hypothetical protein [Vibrio crassostreae]
MSFYFKLFVVSMMAALLSLFIFLELSTFTFEEEAEYPIGSFEVHAFFDQHWHSL